MLVRALRSVPRVARPSRALGTSVCVLRTGSLASALRPVHAPRGVRSFSVEYKHIADFGPRTPAPDAVEEEMKKSLAAGDTQWAGHLHPDGGFLGHTDVFQKFLFPTSIGLIGAAMISKEVILINEETLLVGTFSAFFMTLYMVLSDSAMKGINEWHTEQRKSVFDNWDARLTALWSIKNMMGANKKMVQDMRSLRAELDEFDKQIPAATQQHERLKYRNMTEQLLKMKFDTEARARSQYLEQSVNKVTADVRQQATPKTQEEKDAAIAYSLKVAEAVASGAQDIPPSPVDALFQKEFAQYHKRTEAAMEKPFPVPANIDDLVNATLNTMDAQPDTAESVESQMDAQTWAKLRKYLEPVIAKNLAADKDARTKARAELEARFGKAQ